MQIEIQRREQELNDTSETMQIQEVVYAVHIIKGHKIRFVKESSRSESLRTGIIPHLRHPNALIHLIQRNQNNRAKVNLSTRGRTDSVPHVARALVLRLLEEPRDGLGHAGCELGAVDGCAVWHGEGEWAGPVDVGVAWPLHS